MLHEIFSCSQTSPTCAKRILQEVRTCRLVNTFQLVDSYFASQTILVSSSEKDDITLALSAALRPAKVEILRQVQPPEFPNP